ncbi:hypothetical protein EBS02_03460 [bacterium]|nr:hypothetical protein [bacterium]
MSQEYREEEKEKEREREKEKNEFSLRLGDIIEISAPKNDILNEHTFFIEYINDVRIVLIDVATMDQIQLNRDEETGVFSDKSIREIRLVSRSEHDGYARQNNLVVGTWIEIHIGGDVSTILTGEITSLEEDQIEVRVVPEMDIIYIDFEYKGIPEDIPIKSIIIRDKPSTYKHVEFTKNPEVSESSKEYNDPTLEYLETGEIKIHADEEAEEEESVIDLLKTKVAKSKEAAFGEDLESECLKFPKTKNGILSIYRQLVCWTNCFQRYRLSNAIQKQCKRFILLFHAIDNSVDTSLYLTIMERLSS